MCCTGNLHKVQEYVHVKEDDPYVVDNVGRSAIWYTIWGDCVAVARHLMRAAPGIHLILSTNLTSSLQAAIAVGTPELVAEILRPFPVTFRDGKLINDKTLQILYTSHNSLLSPVELAKGRGDQKILDAIRIFTEFVRCETSITSIPIVPESKE